jgi:hypothetical protein
VSWYIVVLAVLLYAPGSIAFELSRESGQALATMPAAERHYARFAVSFVIVSWLSLILGELGLFRPWSFAALAAACVIGALALRRKGARSRIKTEQGPPRHARATSSLEATAGVLTLVLIVLIGAASFFPAFEQVAGARDPTTYVLWGMRLAREGGIVAHDPLVASLEPEQVDTLFGPGHLAERAHYGSRFIGFYLVDPASGRVEAQGLPLYPTWIGLGSLAGGETAGLAITPLLALFACIAAFYLGRFVWGTAVGALAALWLALSPPQVWFARYANAEILGQVLVLVGLYALVRYRRHPTPLFGLLAAMALGLTWLSVAWLILLAVPLYGLLAFDLARGRVQRRDWLWFWLPLGVLGLHAVSHAAFFAWSYIFDLLRVVGLTEDRGPVGVAAGLGALGLAACWWWGRGFSQGPQQEAGEAKRTEQPGAGDERLARAGRWLMAAIIVALAAYGYWIRPFRYPYWHGLSVTNLALGITGIAFWLTVVGAVLLLISRRQLARGGLVLLVLIGAGLPVLINPQIYPHNMWTLRRYLPVVIPLCFTVGSYALWRLWGLLAGTREPDSAAGEQVQEQPRSRAVRWRPTLATGFAVGLALALALALATRSTPYRQAQDYQGIRRILDSIAAEVEPDALLLFEARSGWRMLDLAPGLAYARGFDVVSVYREEDDLESLQGFFLRMAQLGRPVYFFTQGFNYYFPEPRAEPHRKWSYWLEELEEVQRRLPLRANGSRVPFASYKLVVGQRNGPLEQALDIGNWDDVYVAEMLPPEPDWRMFTRWSEATAFIWLPGLGLEASQIELHLHSPEIPSQPGRTLGLLLDGIDLGEVVLEPTWRTYTFQIPPEWRPQEGSVPRLTLSTTPFRPADEFDSDDRRRLGVRLDWVRWRTEGTDEANRPNPMP